MSPSDWVAINVVTVLASWKSEKCVFLMVRGASEIKWIRGIVRVSAEEAVVVPMNWQVSSFNDPWIRKSPVLSLRALDWCM